MEVEAAGATESLNKAMAPPQSLSVIRNLASCNIAARSKSLRELTNWLPTQLQISDDDMKKLWKGLFYCIWHADKAPVQSNLIDKLSNLMLTLDLSLALHYFSVFLTTLRREWSGIDVLRLDKFYLLIRRFVNCSFQLLKKNAWDLELSPNVMNIYEDKSLLADEKKFLGNGVNYHIVSVFLEELKSYLPVSREIYEILFEPLFRVMCKCQDKVLVGKIRSNVFEFLLSMGKSLLQKKKNGEDADLECDEIVNFGTIALTMGFAAKFYELGSSMDCFQGNRKILFGLHQEFLKLEKDLEVSGIEVSIPAVQVQNDDDEVPELVPIVSDETQKVSSSLVLEASENVDEGAKKSSKKKKKKKGTKKGSNDQKNEREKENDNDNDNVLVADGESISISNGVTSDGIDIISSEPFRSNLRLAFEKVADEDNLEKDGGDSSLAVLPEITPTNGKITKKRKRVKSAAAHADLIEQENSAVKTGEKSAKKVRFSIKHNLVWKPQSPLPPQSVRIPPSVTPRGSALKKGVPPGPIREMPPAKKRVKKKKVRKVKPASPAVKGLWKLQSLSI